MQNLSEITNVEQALGRAGRLIANGDRETSMVTLLYNSQDLAVAGMSSGMKKLCCSKNNCLKEILRSTYVGKYSVELNFFIRKNWTLRIAGRGAQWARMGTN